MIQLFGCDFLQMNGSRSSGGEELVCIKYDNETRLLQDGWEQVTSLGMVVSADNGSFVVWMREQNKVISVRSRCVFLFCFHY